jgi:probable glucuronoxylan glucuronosyltransferase IRX7
MRKSFQSYNSKTNLTVRPITIFAVLAFIIICIWSLYTVKNTARLQVIKTSSFISSVRSTPLKIYLYNLPKKFNKNLLKNIKSDKKRYQGYQDQMAEAIIYSQFLKSNIRTKNPNEADLFFVPLFSAASVSQLVHKPEQREKARKLVLETQQYIEKHHPFWKKYNGADHVWIFTHDHGICFDTSDERAFESKTLRKLMEKVKDSIFLTNTGDLMSPCFNPKSSIVIPPFIPRGKLRNLFDRSKLEGTPRDILASFRGQTTLIKPRDPWFRYLMLYGSKEDKKHNHGKEPSILPCFDWASNANNCATCQSACCAAEITEGRVYSNGVRQRLLSMFGKEKNYKKTGILVSRKKSPKWMDEMKRSKFCLAPIGFAKWSIRCFESIVAGCIPVIIANNLTLPFEDYLNWPAFSVIMKETDISKLTFILNSISPSKVIEMQANLNQVRLHFMYGGVPGVGNGNAFDLIIDSLKQKFIERKPLFSTYEQSKRNSVSLEYISKKALAPWRQWVPIGKRRVESVPFPPSFNPEISDKDKNICLATQLSSDRADLLARILYRWDGPVSAAVLIKKGTEENGEKVEDMFAEAFSDRTEGDPDQVLTFSYLRYEGSHPSGKFQHYPVNRLRNMALHGCKTNYMLVLDVDFLPSANAYSNLQGHLHLLDDEGRNALVIPAFEVDADVLNSNSGAMDNVRYKNRLRQLYMVDKRKRWRDTPRTLSKARAFQLMHYKDGHHPTNTEKWMHSFKPYTVEYKWGYEPYLLLKRPFPLFEESFIGYGQNKVSYAYHLAAARFSFIVVPDVFVIHVHTDKSIGVKVVSDSDKFKINQKAIDIIKVSKDFTVGWSCWRPFIDKLDNIYGFRAVEPCWVSEYVWNDVNSKRGQECVANL